MKCKVISVLALVFALALAEDLDEAGLDPSTLTLVVEHSLDNGRSFSPRGVLAVQSVRSGSTSFKQETLTADELVRMDALCQKGGVYLLRAKAEGAATVSNSGYHRAVEDPCALLEGQLADVLTLHLDWRNQLVGFSAAAAAKEAPPTTKRKGDKPAAVEMERREAAKANTFK